MNKMVDEFLYMNLNPGGDLLLPYELTHLRPLPHIQLKQAGDLEDRFERNDLQTLTNWYWEINVVRRPLALFGNCSSNWKP